jgi:hypothetical protein
MLLLFSTGAIVKLSLYASFFSIINQKAAKSKFKKRAIYFHAAEICIFFKLEIACFVGIYGANLYIFCALTPG